MEGTKSGLSLCVSTEISRKQMHEAAENPAGCGLTSGCPGSSVPWDSPAVGPQLQGLSLSLPNFRDLLPLGSSELIFKPPAPDPPSCSSSPPVCT